MIDQHLLDSGIAIVGMAGRFPGARDVDEYWQNLRGGVESIRALTDEELLAAGVSPSTLSDPDYVKAAGVLDDVPMFDAAFFGVSPKDAGIMDPQHRHFLECAVTALEHAGHAPRRFDGAIGVFAGCGMNAYFLNNVLTNPELVRSVGFFLLRHTGNDRDFLPTMVSYKLDLRGPSLAVQTACSTSLVAIHTACQSLLAGECDMALAGGSTILVPHGQGYFYRENEPVSPDGHCRPFDVASQGTVVSSGVGVVVLRRLSDALADGDVVHAVIRGSAINNDGAGKVGYLAPSVGGHARVVTEALALAGVSADSIDYVEAHGTGTQVGDPIEVAALTQAYRETSERIGYCRIGSVKSNIGHLDTAAGVASIIKVARALEAREMPPTLHFTAPNPDLHIETSPFVVNAELRPWPADDGPRRAGVSSLGIGGTNAHVVLEEGPPKEPSSQSARAQQVLLLATKSVASLDTASANLANWLRANPDVPLADVAFTLQEGREHWEHRRVVVAESAVEAAEALDGKDTLRVFTAKREGAIGGVVFMFPGAGAQYPNMARDLYAREPVFRRELDRCFEILRPRLDYDLQALMFPVEGDEPAAARELERASRLCPAIFVVEWALAKLLGSWGIQPAAMIGHSLGEYAVACMAGVMSLEDALHVVVLRGNLIDSLSGGAMLSLAMSETEAREAIGDRLDLAAVNSPGLTVVSGLYDDVASVQQELAAREIDARLIPVSAAGHSRHLDVILDAFRKGLAQVRLAPPNLPYVSNVTGTWIRPDEPCNPEYWVRHLRGTVRFADGLATLLEEPDRVLLEVGPGQSLCSFARQQPNRPRGVVPTMRKPADAVSDVHVALASVGRLWAAGLGYEWSKLRDADERRHRVPLPTYPFEHKPYWIEPGKPVAQGDETVGRLEKLTSLDSWLRRPGWRPNALIEDMPTEEPTNWLVFEDAAGIGAAVSRRLREAGHRVVAVRPGDTFYRFDDENYSLAPEAGRVGYDQLVAALVESDTVPGRIVHFWSVTRDESHRPGSSFLHRNLECGFYSILYLAQALGEALEQLPSDILVVSNGMQAVLNDEALLHPEKATVLGPVRVIPREFPGLSCRSLDVALPARPASGWRSAGQSAMDLEPVAEAVLAELAVDLSGTNVPPVVAWRQGQRFEEALLPAKVPASGKGTVRIREQGVYLVTGGLGGIGFALAEQLALRHRARVVLTGRSGLPEESAWNRWLETHGERDRTARQIRAIRNIREQGGDVLVMSADTADIGRMREVIEQAKARFGALHGVLHAAGGAEDGVIQAKSADSVERVFSPKLHGTLLVAELVASEPLDFFVVFSSTSALLGPPGQVDYVGANAFLNAFAEQRTRAGRFTVAVDWGVWNEVGAAGGLSDRLRGVPAESPLHRLTGHPLLEECVLEGGDAWKWEATWNSKDTWVLDDHRNGSGVAILPGTAYLEIARAAWSDAFGPAPLEISEASFLSPLLVPDLEPREVEISLTRDGSEWAFEIRSRGGDLHAQMRIKALRERVVATVDLRVVRNRCSDRKAQAAPGEALASSQAAQLGFGPRWKVLRETGFGNDEAFAALSLDPRFEGDLQVQPLHPGLLDIATGFALPLVAAPTVSDAVYVPLTYSRIRVYGALQPDIVSHVVSRPGNRPGAETVSFDVTLTDAAGRVLVAVEGYQMRRVGSSTALLGSGGSRPSRSAGQHQPTPAEQVFLETYAAGIRVEEGFEALTRVLSAPKGGAVVVSSIDVAPWRARLQKASEHDLAGPSVKFARPELESAYEGPRDELERRLAAIWEELLGVDQIGIHDDFFELGGHSLIAVRLFARIKKEWGIDWPISVLFDAPTIARCGDLLRPEVGDVAAADGATAPAPAPQRGPAFRYLVAMNQVGETTKLPLFLVAGMFGNVLNLRHLAANLGRDQPVYALQAKGLYGDDEPHRRFEDMARDYLEEIRQIQPHGPYLIGGFSGGGVTAFEMAHQLRAAGEEVGAIFMLDAIPPPPAWPQPTRADLLRIHWQRLLRQGPAYLTARIRNRIQWERERRERRTSTVPREQTPAEFRSELIEIAFREALGHYRMKPYAGPILLYRPPLDLAHRLGRGRVANSKRELIDPDNWWAPWVTGVKIHEVPGNHDSMVLEPNVRVLAGRLRGELEPLQARYGRDRDPDLAPVGRVAART